MSSGTNETQQTSPGAGGRGAGGAAQRVRGSGAGWKRARGGADRLREGLPGTGWRMWLS